MRDRCNYLLGYRGSKKNRLHKIIIQQSAERIEQSSSRKQHASSCQLTTHCVRIQTRRPIFQLTDKRPNKPAAPPTQTPQQQHVQYVFHASCTGPKSIGEKDDPPMRHRGERMQQPIPSVDAVYSDLRLVQREKQTCFFQGLSWTDAGGAARGWAGPGRPAPPGPSFFHVVGRGPARPIKFFFVGPRPGPAHLYFT